MAKFKSPGVIMVTGAAGYVGAMLCHQFSRSPDLKKILAVDIQTMPPILKDNKKIIWITANLAEKIWKIPALINKPEVVIHCAWQAKESYGKESEQKRLNIDSSREVFEFVFKHPFVKKFIYLSSTACYGAYSENMLEKFFNEADKLREEELLEGVQKRCIEEDLQKIYEVNEKDKQVYILRPTFITGPRGRCIDGQGGLPFIPVGSDKWCRQYVHEDDVTDAIAMLTFGDKNIKTCYETYNLAPSDLVFAKDIGKKFVKSIVELPPVAIRVLFYIAWHLSGGKLSTSKGKWRFHSYPIPIDGSAITREYSFEYFYSSQDALAKDEGRYYSG